MSITLREARLVLRFPPGWHAVKWDATPGGEPPDPPPFLHADGIGKLQGALDGRSESSKAVDVVASPPTPVLILIELKDVRSDPATVGGARALAYKGRWKSLPLEIALKVRDTLAGVHGVVQRGEPTEVAAWMRAAQGGNTRVVALVAQDAHRPNEPETKREARDSEMRKNLRRMLAWLTKDPQAVVVLDPLRDVWPRWMDGVACEAAPAP